MRRHSGRGGGRGAAGEDSRDEVGLGGLGFDVNE